MDTGMGEMAPIHPDIVKEFLDGPPKKFLSIFKKGEVVTLKNSRFKIVSLGKKEMRLKLLPMKYVES